ncbi:MAG: GldG family protein [Firmicutes bacterium]|nr:GldG family protein [Bacillota bacterium]
MKNDKAFRIGGYSVLAVLLALAILVGVNVLAAKLPASVTQIDLTGASLFTLSDQTVSLIKGLDKDVELYWMVTAGNEDPKLQLLIDKFDGLSDHLRITHVDPKVNPDFSSMFTDNVGEDLENSIAVVCGDKSQYLDYMDMFDIDLSHYYEDGKYDYKFAGEDVIAAGVDYVIRENLPVVYATTGHGEEAIPGIYQTMIKRDNIDFKSFSFLDNGEIPEDCDALIIHAPKSDFSDDEIAKVKAFLSKGGKLLLSTGASNDGSLLVNITEMMKEYGVTLHKGIIVEPSEENYAYQSPYYIVPQLITHEITTPVRDHNYKVMLPITQGMTKEENPPEGIEIERLMVTSEQAVSKADGFSMHSYDKEEGDEEGQFLIGVAITDSNTGAQIVWYSSAYIADYDTNIRVSGANQEVYVNSLNWMCDAHSSIAIHQKDLGYNYLTIPSSVGNIMTVVLVAVIPLLYFLVGLVITLRRQRK